MSEQEACLDYAIEAFAERQQFDRPFLLRSYITGKKVSAASSDWLESMAKRVGDDPDLIKAWMRLALIGDAADLKAAVQTWTNGWIESDTEEWIEEQIFTGNWANIERENAA